MAFYVLLEFKTCGLGPSLFTATLRSAEPPSRLAPVPSEGLQGGRSR